MSISLNSIFTQTQGVKRLREDSAAQNYPNKRAKNPDSKNFLPKTFGFFSQPPVPLEEDVNEIEYKVLKFDPPVPLEAEIYEINSPVIIRIAQVASVQNPLFKDLELQIEEKNEQQPSQLIHSPESLVTDLET